MLISPAYAQDVAGLMGGAVQFAPLVLIFVVFYFLLIRPQQRKAKDHQELLKKIARGDTVITQGGLIGKVWWQIALSLFLLVTGFILTTYIAARIYRVGILMYGKKITLKEMGRWLFSRK